MCRAQEEGGRRCQGHLRGRIKERDEEETRLNERLSLLKMFKTFVTERMEAGDSFTAARKAFADKEGIPVTSLPRDIKKLDRDLDSVKNQLVQNEVRRNKDKGELAIIEERQEARAAARAALPEEERARRDRKAAAERARRARLKAEREEAEAVADVPEERADIATITAGEEAELRERIEQAVSAAKEKFSRADWKRVQNIHTKSAVRERMSELGSTDAYDREIEELEKERTRLKANHEANLEEIEAQVRKEHADELASAREAEMNRAEGTISLADARAALERDRYLGAALRKHVGAERGPVKVHLYEKVKGGEPVRIGSEGGWDVSNGNAQVIADAVNDFTANSLHATRPGGRRQGHILNWTRTRVEDDGSVTIMMAAGVNQYRKERLGENILNSIWGFMNA